MDFFDHRWLQRTLHVRKDFCDTVLESVAAICRLYLVEGTETSFRGVFIAAGS